MELFTIGECRVCGKNCFWISVVDGLLAVFDVCSDECLENCKEYQETTKESKES